MLDLSNNVCEYEVNLLTNEKLLEENETCKILTTLDVRSNAHPPKRFHQSISRNFLRKIRLKCIKNYSE